MGCLCEYCRNARQYGEKSNQVTREIEQWNNGKTFVKNAIVDEIRWIREGIEKGFALDPLTILAYLEQKVNEKAEHRL